MARQPRPGQGDLTLLDPLLRCSAFVVKARHILGPLIQVGHDKPYAWEKFVAIPLHLGRHPRGPIAILGIHLDSRRFHQSRKKVWRFRREFAVDARISSDKSRQSRIVLNVVFSIVSFHYSVSGSPISSQWPATPKATGSSSSSKSSTGPIRRPLTSTWRGFDVQKGGTISPGFRSLVFEPYRGSKFWHCGTEVTKISHGPDRRTDDEPFWFGFAKCQ